MSIRGRILAFQIVVATMLLSVASATYFSIDRIDYYFDRNRLAGQQLDTVIRLSAAMNRYSENIAELLLLGRTELDDFHEARDSLENSFARLSDLIELELRLVRSVAERVEESEELERLESMEALYESIDLQAQRLLFLRDQNRLAEAIDLFQQEIEESLDAELETLLAAAIADEEAELSEIDAQTDRLERRMSVLVIGVTLAALAVSGAAGLLLSQALIRPIAALASATRAIGEGDLDHRVAYDRRDEFGDLVRQFNRTAAQLEAQRARLLETQAGLETEVTRRTGELEEANARLQRLDHMRMLFLADIGHELRTPLTVLRGEAEVALRGARPVEEHRETLRRIVQLTQQMGRLIEDLLFLARAEVGAVRFEMQPLRLQDVLALAVGEARVLAEAAGLHLDARLPSEPCQVEGDAERLTQALLIALDNAVKYSDPGERIEVDLDCGGREAVVRVRSRGPEIPAADLPFVFNRFYRGRQNAARGASGSGLGLPIAKWILDSHGGQVDLASAARETVVTLRLPLLYL